MFVSGVLLAAGASSRFGSPKMLASVGENKIPLLRRVLETWLASGFAELIVVLGKDADEIRAAIGDFSPHSGRRSLRFVENPSWDAGMFSSVKTGLAATSADSTHVAVSPADLPFLSKKSLQTVISAAASLDASELSLVVPTHAGRRGHPLLIPAALRSRLLSWPDSARLNQLFEEPDVTVHHIAGFDETILRDVDTPGDLLASRRAPFSF